MIDGSEAIILTEEEATLLLKAIYSEWDTAKIKQLQKLGVLDVVNKLRSILDRRGTDE
jgi:hypothetical protein